MNSTFRSSAKYKTKVVSLTLSGIAIALISLTGCSDAKPSTYQSVMELKEAYTQAGGTCTDTSSFSEITESYGIRGLNCGNNGDALAWFRDDKAKGDFLDLLDGSGEKYVVGQNWLILTGNTSKFQEALGGEVKG